MNCQDITRIANSGNFAELREAERAAAAAHARTCRYCAPLWAAHSRLAGLQIPPMPAELALRCRSLAAMPATESSGRSASRRLILLGALVVTAAAAAMLAMYLGGNPTSEAPSAATVRTAANDVAPAIPAPQVAPPADLAANTAAAKPPAAATPRPAALPLLPAPPRDDALWNARVDLALQKAVERHPELVEGPPIDDQFVVAIVMREDGRVIDSVARQTAPADARNAVTEVEQLLQRDGGSRTFTSRPKHTRLPDGRALRADVSLRVGIVPANYDAGRSSIRVMRLVRERYRDLLLPAAGGEWNRLTLFLSEDGQIQREQVERVGPRNAAGGRTIMGSDANDVAFAASELIARPLALDVEQIGLLGSITLEEGSMVMVSDANGEFRRDDQRRILQVFYAWPRRVGENGPTWGQGAGSSSNSSSSYSPASTVDRAAALLVVEQEIPDAFRVKDPDAGTPTVVLTDRGELIKAGRLHTKSDKPLDWLINEQLVPGAIRLYQYSTVRLTNDRGETADVRFAWEVEPASPANQTNAVP